METLRRATEEASLSQDRQTFRKEQQNYSLQVSAAWVTPPPLRHGDLEEGKPHKIISSKTEKIRVKRS